MILLIQLAQVSTYVNICLVSQIPGNSDGSVPFLVWSIFRWTIRNQSLLWDLWHYPGWFSWFYWFDTLQRIQTYHRVKLTDHFWFVLILVLCSSWKYKILVALAHLSFALLHGELKWKRKFGFGGAVAESRQAYTACRLFSQHLPKSKCYQTTQIVSELFLAVL